MTVWPGRLAFRTRLTLGWTLAFGLLLAIANFAIYATFRTYLERDLDQKVRTIAATELASSIDGLDIHLHEVPSGACPRKAARTRSIGTSAGRSRSDADARRTRPSLSKICTNFSVY